MIALPRALLDALARRIASVDARHVARVAREMSDEYRRAQQPGAPPASRLVRTADDALAYGALLMPATFAQLAGAFAMVPARVGPWSPRSVLDLGSGPGTGAWAAASTWEGLERVVGVEREAAFRDMARDLARASGSAAVRDATWVEGDLREDALPRGPFDLVVLGHVLTEIDRRDRVRVVARAWDRCGGVLVIVEPGTPAGYDAAVAARDEVIARNGFTLAPCPHDAPCPLRPSREAEPDKGRDWCHFSQRVERPEFQRRVKDASLSWEDAKFSLAVMSRTASVAPPWARVLRHPWHGKGHVDLTLCAREGLVPLNVTRKRPEAWRLAKKLEWGSAVESRDDLP